MTRIDISARAADLIAFGSRRVERRAIDARWWMAAAFFVSFVLASIVLARSGTGEDGTVLGLRLTARWAFLLFWPAYAGGALAKLCGGRFAVLARRGREFGLAFAAALLVHIALVLWLYRVETKPNGAMIFFWVGVLCTYALALFSWPLLRDALGLRLWRLLCTLALEYIALVFAADFVLEPLRGSGIGEYPLTYLPFALVLIGGACLRLAAFGRRWISPSAMPKAG